MSYPIKIDVLIFTPTSEERQYSQNLLPQNQLNCHIEIDGKRLFYDIGNIVIFEKNYKIILISPEKAGPLEAQGYLTKVLEIWNPDLLIVTGVAGGYSFRKVKIGDLLFPLEITEFALFKDTKEGQEPRPNHFKVSEELVIAAKRFFDEKVEEIQETSNFENISCLSDGKILSSVVLQAKEAVQKEAIKKLLDGDGKIYGIEQESSGIARVIENHREIKWMVVRCVMDLADEDSRTSIKKDENKRLATELAAKFCFKFLEWYFKKVKSKSDQKIQYLVKFLNNLGDLDIQSTSYDENDFCQTKKYSLDGIPKKFDMEGKCTYRDKKIPFFVDFNKKKFVNEIENEYKDFVKNSLSIWLNENEDGDWFARFIFISDHPCFCNEQFRFKNSIEFLKAVLADLDQALLENFDENKTKIKTNFLPLLGLIYVTPDFYLLAK